MTQPNWTSLYPATVGPILNAEHEDILSAYRASIARDPDAVALFFFDQIITYGQLDSDSDALAAWLQDQGVGPGQRVSVISQNLPAFPLMILAAWKIGAVPVPGNPQYKHQELALILEDAEPSAVLLESDGEDVLHKALKLAGLEGIPTIVAHSNIDGRQVTAGGNDSLETVLERYGGQKPGTHHFAPDDLGLILYTSGTTGKPKGAMLSHQALAFNSQFVREWCNLRPDSRIFAMAPFFHITGFVCHICAAFFVGCSNIFNYRFEPGLALDMIRKWEPTFTVGAITAFNALMAAPGVSGKDMKSLEQVYSGGAPIPPALKAEIEKALEISIYPAYGMTETTSPAVFAPFGVPTPVLDGQLSTGIPTPSTELKIVDDQGVELERGQPGEILMRGPQIMQGYWRNPEETARTISEDGWLHSGDVGMMDDAGWLYLVDRKKDVIIASGFKVWPREVEDVLYTHPAVREAAVIGVADAYRGENVKACVSLREDESVTEEELIDFCRSSMTGYKVPRIVELFDELPKTVTGKIQRAALREGV